MSHFSQQVVDSRPSQDLEHQWNYNNTGAFAPCSVPPKLSTFPRLDTLSSSLWASNPASASDWTVSDMGAIMWPLPNPDVGVQIDVEPRLASSADSALACPSASSKYLHLPRSEPTGPSTLPAAFEIQTLIIPQTASSGEETRLAMPSYLPSRHSSNAPTALTPFVPRRASSAMETSWRRSSKSPLPREDKHPHSLESPYRSTRNHGFIQNNFPNLSRKIFRPSLSSQIGSIAHFPMPSTNSEPKQHSITATNYVSLTRETYDWMFSVMYPKRRSNKQIPTPSGECHLCPSVSKKPGILQQHLTILHRQKVARRFILGQHTPFDLVIAIAFTVAQLRSKDVDSPARTECDVFSDLLRVSPKGLESVSLADFPILGERLTEFANHESWKGLQCARCGVTTTRKIALVEHAAVCNRRDGTRS